MSETVRDDSGRGGGSGSDGGTGSGIGNGRGRDHGSDSAAAGEHLVRLHSALAERHVPGLKLEPAWSGGSVSGDPVVYTAGTCTRVHGGCFLIHRVSGHGQVLETVSLGVGRQGTAVAIIAVMAGALTL